MPRFPRKLTRLEIAEVSVVDRGAGEGCNVMIAKRQESKMFGIEDVRKAFSAGRLAKADVHQLLQNVCVKRRAPGESFEQTLARLTSRNSARYEPLVEELFAFDVQLGVAKNLTPAEFQKQNESSHYGRAVSEASGQVLSPRVSTPVHENSSQQLSPGTRQRERDPSASDKTASDKLHALAEAHQNATGKSLSESYSHVLRTPQGQKLFAQCKRTATGVTDKPTTHRGDQFGF